MERIVQLNEYEYKTMADLAKLKEKQIQERAKKLYEEKGILGIEVELNIHENYNETFELRSYGTRNGDWDNSLIPYAKKRELIALVQEKARVLFLKSFSRELKTMGEVNRLYREAEEERRKFKVWTLTGWLMAIMMIIYLVIKG